MFFLFGRPAFLVVFYEKFFLIAAEVELTACVKAKGHVRGSNSGPKEREVEVKTIKLKWHVVGSSLRRAGGTLGWIIRW